MYSVEELNEMDDFDLAERFSEDELSNIIEDLSGDKILDEKGEMICALRMILNREDGE